MKILIVGSGLAGLTSAYYLAKRGHAVTVIDRAAGPALETSFANGSLLTPSMANPWNTPGCWRVLLRSIGRSDSPLQLRMRALPGLAQWGVEFLRNSDPVRFRRNQLHNLRLASYSLEVLQSLRRETDLQYGQASRGTLRVFRDEKALARAIVGAEELQSSGLNYRRLTTAQTLEFEPALVGVRNELAGSIYYSVDESGDAYQFCVALAERARRLGVLFRFEQEVSRIEVKHDEVVGLETLHDRFSADQYVVAAGSYSTPLLQKIGINLPVRPAKGYSITFSRYEAEHRLKIPLVDDDLHAVVVPLEGAIRVAGTAEFAGYDLTMRPARIGNLVSLLHRVLPEARFDVADARPWCGLRSMSADGVPIIDRTPFSNLLVNSGHGHLGWTMAAGSGHLLADLICGSSTAIDEAPYQLSRFGRRA